MLCLALLGACSGAERDAAVEHVPSPPVVVHLTPEASKAPRFALQLEGTSRLEALQGFALAQGFEVFGAPDLLGGLGDATTSIEAESVEGVLTALLHDVPFGLRYAVPDTGGGVRLQEMELLRGGSFQIERASASGDAEALEFAGDDSPRAAELALAERIGQGPAATAREWEARLERVRESEAVAREEAMERLGSEDPLERQDAVPQLDPNQRSDASRLGDLALRDPDPRVRLEAVERLSFGDPAVAIPILSEAVHDESAPVAGTAASELDRALGLTSDEDGSALPRSPR